MGMSELDSIVKGLLDKAWEDLRASRILYDNGLKALALNHLEQASEKILKAYFLGYIIDFLVFLYRIPERAGAYNVYRSMHQLVKHAVRNYSIPKNLGHRFDAFLNKFMPKLYESMCGGEFADYYEYSVKNGLIPYIEKHRGAVIGILVEEGLTREQAGKLVDVAIEYLKQAPGTLRSDKTRSSLCKNDNARKFGRSLEELRRSKEPCLKATLQFYEFVSETVERYFREEVMKNKTLIEDLEKARRALKQLAEYTEIDLFEKYGENIDTFTYSVVRGNILVYMILPLHYCLVKYYEATRYPDKEIPEEVLEKEYSEIPDAITVLEEVHSIVKELASPYNESDATTVSHN